MAEKTIKPATAAHRRKLTPAQWAEAEALWESGQVTLSDLSRKFGKAEETFSRHFSAAGVQKGAKKGEHAEKVKEEVAKNIVDDAAVLATRIRETKEDHYKMAQAIGKLTWKEIVDAQREGRAVATSLPNLKALNQAMQVLKSVREERWAVLGLDNPDTEADNDLPDLVISELTAEQIEDMQRRQEDEAKGLGMADIDLDLEEPAEMGDDDVVEEGGA